MLNEPWKVRPLFWHRILRIMNDVLHPRKDSSCILRCLVSSAHLLYILVFIYIKQISLPWDTERTFFWKIKINQAKQREKGLVWNPRSHNAIRSLHVTDYKRTSEQSFFKTIPYKDTPTLELNLMIQLNLCDTIVLAYENEWWKFIFLKNGKQSA